MINLQNKALAALVTSVFAAIACQAQTTTVDTRNLLWRVESAQNTVYLLGSIHVLDEGSYPLDSTIEGAFDDSDALALEINLDSAMAGLPMQLMATGMYTDGRRLSTELPDTTLTLLDERLQQIGLTSAAVDRFRPWVVAFILMTDGMQEGGLDAAHGVDMYFKNRAAERGIDMYGLETAEDQINAFSGMSDLEQAQFLHSMLTDTSTTSATHINNTVEAWRQGNVQKLEEILKVGFAGQPTLYQRLVVDRNRNWVPQIERFLTEGRNYMVVVGALHLVGEHSVIEMLREKGYTVEQM